jgi:hypothetical protein
LRHVSLTSVKKIKKNSNTKRLKEKLTGTAGVRVIGSPFVLICLYFQMPVKLKYEITKRDWKNQCQISAATEFNGKVFIPGHFLYITIVCCSRSQFHTSLLQKCIFFGLIHRQHVDVPGRGAKSLAINILTHAGLHSRQIVRRGGVTFRETL